MRGKKRIKGPLDPLLDCLPNPPITRLCEELGVTRMSVYRWQKKIRDVSPINRLKINILCMYYSIEQIF